MRLPASFHYFIFMGALSMISSCTEDEISSDHFLVIAENQGATLTLIASPTDGGSVSTQEGLYWIEAEAQPYTDYAFTGWTGDFEGAANPVRLTLCPMTSLWPILSSKMPTKAVLATV